MKRVVSAVVLLIPAFLITRYLPAAAFAVMVCAFAGLAVLEFCGLARRRGFAPQQGAALAASLLLSLSFLWPDRAVLPTLAAVLVGVPMLSLIRRDDMADKFGNLLMTLFPAVFLGLLMGYVIGLRVLPAPEGHDLPFLLLLVVAAGDTGAFYGGRAWGRRLLAPRLSPRKTWEGLACGVVAAVAAAFLARVWFMHRLQPIDCVALGLLLALVGCGGDLVESALKRWAGAKDSSSLIPGHGGVLDRVDGLLFAAPVLFYYHLAMGSLAP